MASVRTIIDSFCFFAVLPACIHAALITAGSSLSPPLKWDSPNGSFSFGFFNLTADSYYVGIWFDSLLPFQQANVVWVANRDQSVSVNSSLVLTQTGLQLINSSSAVVWQSGNSGDDKSALVGEMLDSGNFVLRETLSNSTVWETFGNPTNTILPASNLSYPSTGLISWTTSTNPSPGLFSFTFTDSTKVRLLFANSSEYWSRPGDEFGIYSNGSVGVFNQSSRSLLWAEGNCVPNGPTKVTLSVDGNLRLLQWFNNSRSWETLWRALYFQCDVFNTCGDNGICNYDQNRNEATGDSCPESEANYSDICTCPVGFSRETAEYGNCIPTSSIGCSENSTRLPHTTFGMQPLGAPSSTNVDENSCVEGCLDSCSCNAAIYSNTSRECWQLQEALRNGTQDASRAVTAFVRIPASNFTTSTTHSFPTVAIIIIPIALTAILFSVLLFFIRYIQPWRKTREERAELDTLLHLREKVGAPKRFSYRELSVATAGFSDDRILGSGGFGSVFTGVLQVQYRGEGRDVAVAVKRLNKAKYHDREGEDDFLVEVETLASIRHVNVVSLVGYCAEGTERLLVYELMPNGNLASHLFEHKPESQPLKWETRLQIVMGAATGIEYLHTQCPKKIVHMDIKPANILLDSRLEAKVADFGVAQIMGEEVTHMTNVAPGGTPTYMAPECRMMGGRITEKADVYSFGVTMLEIVSGRRMSWAGGEGREGRRRMVGFEEAFTWMKAERLEEMADERLQGDYNREELERVVKGAFWCLQAEYSQRPTMAELLQMLRDHDHGRLRDLPPIALISHPSLAHTVDSIATELQPEQLTAAR